MFPMRITASPKKVSLPPFLVASRIKIKIYQSNPLPVTPPKNFKLAARAGVVEILIYLLKSFGLRITSNSLK